MNPDLAAIEARHWALPLEDGTICGYCGRPWPCDARILLDERDRWQEDARRYAENADYWREKYEK